MTNRTVTQQEHMQIDEAWKKVAEKVKDPGAVPKMFPESRLRAAIYNNRHRLAQGKHCPDGSFVQFFQITDHFEESIDWFFGYTQPNPVSRTFADNTISYLFNAFAPDDYKNRITALLPFLTAAQRNAVETVVKSLLN